VAAAGCTEGGGDCGKSGFLSADFSGGGLLLLSECCLLREPLGSSKSGVRGLLSSAFISTPVSGSVIGIARDALLGGGTPVCGGF
jgi:hypothetical protein